MPGAFAVGRLRHLEVLIENDGKSLRHAQWSPRGSVRLSVPAAHQRIADKADVICTNEVTLLSKFPVADLSANQPPLQRDWENLQ